MSVHAQALGSHLLKGIVGLTSASSAVQSGNIDPYMISTFIAHLFAHSQSLLMARQPHWDQIMAAVVSVVKLWTSVRNNGRLSAMLQSNEGTIAQTLQDLLHFECELRPHTAPLILLQPGDASGLIGNNIK